MASEVKDLRDAPVPAHVCSEWVAVDGYCLKCGEKVGASRPLRGPVSVILGLRPDAPQKNRT